MHELTENFLINDQQKICKNVYKRIGILTYTHQNSKDANLTKDFKVLLKHNNTCGIGMDLENVLKSLKINQTIIQSKAEKEKEFKKTKGKVIEFDVENVEAEQEVREESPLNSEESYDETEQVEEN